jgi:ATP-dependent Lon protease
MVVPLLVGRASSLAAVEEAVESEEPVFLCTQKDASIEEPKDADLHTIGVAAQILQTLRMADGSMKVVVEGLGRGTATRFYLDQEVPEAMVAKLEPAHI